MSDALGDRTLAPGPPTAGEPFPARSPAYLADPYRYLRELREQSPVVVDPGSRRWFLLRFDDVEAGLATITRGDDERERRHRHFPGNPFALDGPGHTGPRRIIMPTFSNRAVQRFRGRAQEIVDTALAGKEQGGDLEVVDDIGFPLPFHLTCDILGVPPVADVAELRSWTWKSLELIDAFLTPEQLAEDLEASACLAAHLREVIEWKRSHLADDVVSAVIAAADEGRDLMHPDQVVPYVHTLYLAGMHTTVNQTALSLHALLQHRSQVELLRSEPALLENAVEELLRYEPTAQYMRSTGTSDHEIGGVTIPAGQEVVCWIASANRDGRRWGATADALDIRREDARHHIAFGKGPHVCVGSWLARLELQVVVGTVVSRFPNTELVDQPRRWESNVIRGPEELVLQLRP
jgi:cytochrome P450